MIVVTTIEDYYFIGHFPQQNTDSCICFFRKDFLSEKTLTHIQHLSIFRNREESFYSLNNKQEQEATDIFRKIMRERNSGYIFSDDMQRTYLIELIHFITKLHLNAIPVVQASVN